MTFRFPHFALLKFRESIEEKELLELEHLRQRALALEAEIETLNLQQQHEQKRLNESLAAGMTAFEIRCNVERTQLLATSRRNCELSMADNQRRQVEQKLAYLKAKVSRQALVEMRNRKQTEYCKQQDRREQSVIDDLFGARSRFGSGH